MNEQKKSELLLPYAKSVTTLNQIGERWLGCCPVHGEKTASFWVYPERGNCHCYGCGFHGDVIDLYTALSGADFIQAKKDLGLWDDSRPTPKFVPKEKPPTYVEYAEHNKKELYKESLKWLYKGKDVEITGHQTDTSSRFVAYSIAKSDNPSRYSSEVYKKLNEQGEHLAAELFIRQVMEYLD